MSDIRTCFSQADLETIQKAVGEAERNTSGEIRVKIIRKCSDDLNGDIDQQALREFEREGLCNTKDKTGVLILLVLDDRKFKILADKGIYKNLEQAHWNNMAQNLSEYFQCGDYVTGLCRLVSRIGEELVTFFPRSENDSNELPNEVILGDGQ